MSSIGRSGLGPKSKKASAFAETEADALAGDDTAGVPAVRELSRLGAAVAAEAFPAYVGRGPDADVYFNTGVGDQWGMWAPLAEGATRAGAPITAAQLPGSPRVTALIMAGADGGVLAKRMTL